MRTKGTSHMDWTTPSYSPTSRTISNDDAQLAVLLDIREHLGAMRRRMDCHEFLAIPRTLRGIRTNTAKRRKRRTVK